MLRSSEVLALFLKTVGIVTGLAVLAIAIFLLARDAGARRAVRNLWSSTLILLSFIIDLLQECAKSLSFQKIAQLLSATRWQRLCEHLRVRD